MVSLISYCAPGCLTAIGPKAGGPASMRSPAATATGGPARLAAEPRRGSDRHAVSASGPAAWLEARRNGLATAPETDQEPWP
jgi:hypothetical protein